MHHEFTFHSMSGREGTSASIIKTPALHIFDEHNPSDPHVRLSGASGTDDILFSYR